jgi:hypothetical protein
MKKIIKLYEKLCDEYINGNYEKLCSLQSFLRFKYNNEKNPVKKHLLIDVINYAENDYKF